MENVQLLLVGDIDDAPFRIRLDEELRRYNKSNREWSALTGIPEQTIINIRTVGRKGTVRAEYIWAFWIQCTDLNIEYIITGEKAQTKPILDELDKAGEAIANAKKLL